MSRKRILNLTSRKKRDTMLSWSNTNGNGAVVPQVPGPLFLSGPRPTGSINGLVLWNATGRDLALKSGTIGSIGLESVRTDTTCYMVGLKEQITINTIGSEPWLWRRICFTSRQNFGTPAAGDTPSYDYAPVLETSAGMARSTQNLIINNMANTINAIYALVFKGQVGSDWIDPMKAPLDSRRVDIKSDRIMTLRSSNDTGNVWDVKKWYPMRKNLVYDDDENGEVMNTSNWSVTDKRGMGNYYVLDLFAASPEATTSNALVFTPNASLYWHEK